MFDVNEHNAVSVSKIIDFNDRVIRILAMAKLFLEIAEFKFSHG